MSERERGSFSAAEIREIGHLLKAEYPWQRRHLCDVLPSLPETAASFRTTRFTTWPSLTEVFLNQVEANPQRRLRRLLKPAAGEAPTDIFDQVLQHHDGLAQLHYHVAQLLSPTDEAEEQLQKGTARDALLAPELDTVLISNAAKSARVLLTASIRRGKGADRRSAKTPRDLFVNHLLEIYRDVTGKLPGLTNNPGAGGKIQGPAAEFLRKALPKCDFQAASGPTLRRWIEDFRRRHKPEAALKQN
jgi:hypothetical protein